MQETDSIIYCRWLIPIIPRASVYEHQAIVIQDGRIQAILPQRQAKEIFTTDQEIHLPTHALLPGFINAHTHSPMTLFRGLADDFTADGMAEQSYLASRAEMAQ